MTDLKTGRPGITSRAWGIPLDRGLLFMVLLIGSLGFYIVYPLVLILINSFNIATIAEPPVYGLQAWQEAFGDDAVWESLWNTIKVAVALQVVSFPIGVYIAWLLGRTNIPFRHGFEFLFWISFLFPNLATTFGWLLLLDPNTGLINIWLRNLPLLGNLSFNIYSFWGIIWAHLMANAISAKVMLLTPAFRRMDASMEEASQMSGAGTLLTMIRITIPIMTPVIVVVLLLGVIRSFAYFETELLLGIPWGFYVFSTMIVDLASQEPPLVNQAAALGSVILVFLAFFIAFQRRLIAGRQFTTVTGRFKPKIIDLGVWKLPATVFVAIVVFLLVVVPILSVFGGSFMVRFGYFNLPKTWTLEYWQVALNDPSLLAAIKNTLFISGSAALVGPLLFCAHETSRASYSGFHLLASSGHSRCALRTRAPVAVPGHSGLSAFLWHSFPLGHSLNPGRSDHLHAVTKGQLYSVRQGPRRGIPYVGGGILENLF